MPVDAAIVFADIMVPVAAIGVPVRIEAGSVRCWTTRSETRRRGSAPALEPDVDEPHVAETIRLLRKELRSR